jgi:hypothetical protein
MHSRQRHQMDPCGQPHTQIAVRWLGPTVVMNVVLTAGNRNSVILLGYYVFNFIID